MERDCLVSILMLTHNASRYVEESIRTLKEHTKNVSYELIVVDNGSRIWTRRILKKLKLENMIDILLFNRENSLFAKGNNIASKLASSQSKFYLLLNSDVQIRSDNWLETLVRLNSTDDKVMPNECISDCVGWGGGIIVWGGSIRAN